MNDGIQQFLSKQLFSGGAEIITKRVLSEVIKFNREFDGSVQWRDQAIAITDTIHSLGSGLSVIEAVMLAIIEDRWEGLDQAWRDMYGDEFTTFAYKKYGRKPNTIRADLRAVRIFLLDDNKKAKPFGVIEIPKRDISGELIKDDRGKVITSQIEWDATQSTLAKLKVAVPIVEAGKATPSLWSMLMDKRVSSSQMVKSVYESTCDDPHPPQLVIRYRMQGPMLVAYENGSEVSLGELDWEGYYEDSYSLKHRAMNKLLDALGLTLDEHITLYREADQQHADYYDKED